MCDVYENIVLSGGSVHGVCHVGALKRLVELGLIRYSDIKKIACSSAGSIVGLLLSLKMTVDEIWDIILGIDFTQIVDPNALTMLSKFGADTGRKFLSIIENIIFKKTSNKHINFKQLFDFSGIHLIVVGSCLTTKKVVYFDHINTPNFKVSIAVRVSVSLPGLFTPVDIDGNKYIDGSLLNDFPMNLFDDNLDKTIGILLCDDFNTNYSCLEEYIVSVINLLTFNYIENTCRKYKQNTIHITKNMCSAQTFDLSIDDKCKKKLYDTGYDAAQLYVSQTRVTQTHTIQTSPDVQLSSGQSHSDASSCSANSGQSSPDPCPGQSNPDPCPDAQSSSDGQSNPDLCPDGQSSSDSCPGQSNSQTKSE